VRDTLLTSETPVRWSVGVDYADLRRDIDPDNGGEQQLRARVYSGQVGFDVLHWLSVFATAGRSEAKLDFEDEYHDGEFKWSAGAKANWWHLDVIDPTFIAGRLGVQSTLEFAQYRSGSDNDEIKWNEGYADLTLSYEVFVEQMKDLYQYPYSLVLYGGPALSKLDGELGDTDFSESKLVGLIGGVDLYLAHNLALGGQVLYFDETSFSVSLRYHF